MKAAVSADAGMPGWLRRQGWKVSYGPAQRGQPCKGHGHRWTERRGSPRARTDCPARGAHAWESGPHPVCREPAGTLPTPPDAAPGAHAHSQPSDQQLLHMLPSSLEKQG